MGRTLQRWHRNPCHGDCRNSASIESEPQAGGARQPIQLRDATAAVSIGHTATGEDEDTRQHLFTSEAIQIASAVAVFTSANGYEQTQATLAAGIKKTLRTLAGNLFHTAAAAQIEAAFPDESQLLLEARGSVVLGVYTSYGGAMQARCQSSTEERDM